MGKKISLLLFFIVLAVILYVIWDTDPPVVEMETPKEVGSGSRIVLTVEDQGRGIQSVDLFLRQGDYSRILLEERSPKVVLPWEKNQDTFRIELEPEDWLDSGSLKEGSFRLEVTASDSGDFGIFSDRVELGFDMTLDTTPPQVAPLSSQHNIRRGGAETVRYRISGDHSRSGVLVGDNEFEGCPAPGGQNEYVAVFVWAYDQPSDVRLGLWAEDAVGNRSEISLPCDRIERSFRKRRINISDSFIEKVAPEIVRLSPEVGDQGGNLETFLKINQELRELNNQKIREVTSPVSGGISWEQPFLQMKNSKVEAQFADYRSYYYNGEQVDEQTHLGFDLASTANCPIEAANDAVVVFAENLGIYGNCVILDHGLGIYSLYAHLSQIGVEPEAVVQRGEIIGRSGQTGLAGGDHLHYSMLVQGVQTSPLEWWDSKWIRQHVLSRANPVQAP